MKSILVTKHGDPDCMELQDLPTPSPGAGEVCIRVSKAGINFADIFFKSSLISTQNLLTNPTDIVGKINNTYITVTVLIFILFASSSTNLIANYIPSQNILLNLLPSSLTLKSSRTF